MRNSRIAIYHELGSSEVFRLSSQYYSLYYKPNSAVLHIEFFIIKTIIYGIPILHQLIDLNVNLVPLSMGPSTMAANQRQRFLEIPHCDWLPPKLGQDLRRGRLV